MSINRRDFLAGSAALAAGASLAPHTASADEPKPKPEAVLKLSSQINVIPGKELPEKLASMEQWGFDGVEFFGDVVGNEKKYEDAIRNTKLKMSAVCWGSCKGDLVSDVPEKRASAIEAFNACSTRPARYTPRA